MPAGTKIACALPHAPAESVPSSSHDPRLPPEPSYSVTSYAPPTRPDGNTIWSVSRESFGIVVSK